MYETSTIETTSQMRRGGDDGSSTPRGTCDSRPRAWKRASESTVRSAEPRICSLACRVASSAPHFCSTTAPLSIFIHALRSCFLVSTTRLPMSFQWRTASSLCGAGVTVDVRLCGWPLSVALRRADARSRAIVDLVAVVAHCMRLFCRTMLNLRRPPPATLFRRDEHDPAAAAAACPSPSSPSLEPPDAALDPPPPPPVAKAANATEARRSSAWADLSGAVSLVETGVTGDDVEAAMLTLGLGFAGPPGRAAALAAESVAVAAAPPLAAAASLAAAAFAASSSGCWALGVGLTESRRTAAAKASGGASESSMLGRCLPNGLPPSSFARIWSSFLGVAALCSTRCASLVIVACMAASSLRWPLSSLVKVRSAASSLLS